MLGDVEVETVSVGSTASSRFSVDGVVGVRLLMMELIKVEMISEEEEEVEWSGDMVIMHWMVRGSVSSCSSGS
jgi:hypothetical protein